MTTKAGQLKRKALLLWLMKRNKDCNLYAKRIYKQGAMSEVVASSGLSNPNCQRLMKQSGSLVRSYLGTHSATFIRVPRAAKRKAPEELCANALVWPINARAGLQGGRYLRTAPTTWSRTYAAHRLP